MCVLRRAASGMCRRCVCLCLFVSVRVCVHLAHAFSLSAHSAGWQEHQAASWPNAAVQHTMNPCCGPSCRCRWSPTGVITLLVRAILDLMPVAVTVVHAGSNRMLGHNPRRLGLMLLVPGRRLRLRFAPRGGADTGAGTDTGLLKYKTATFKPELRASGGTATLRFTN